MQHIAPATRHQGEFADNTTAYSCKSAIHDLSKVAHLIRDRIPSLMRGRPGPSRATDPKPRLTVGFDRALRMGPCAMPAQAQPAQALLQPWQPQHVPNTPSALETMYPALRTAASLSHRG